MELKHLIREAMSDSLFQANVLMRYARDENLTLINDKLRGVCGITIVDVFVPSKIVSNDVDIVTLKIKFFLSGDDLKAHLHKMANEARKIQGVFSFIPTRASKIETKSQK
jgi:ferredoxin-fold anticodon binding domain-containing protein